MATGAEKALAAVLPSVDTATLLSDLRALGFDVVKRKAAVARIVKAGLVLSDGCKVKIDPNVNPDAADPAHIAELTEFHAEIHALQAQRHDAFLARPAGDGRIWVDGFGRLTPREVVAGYVRAREAVYKNQAAKEAAQRPWGGGAYPERANHPRRRLYGHPIIPV